MTKHPRSFFSEQGIFVILNLNVNKNNVIESELSINLYAAVDTFYFIIYVQLARPVQSRLWFFRWSCMDVKVWTVKKAQRQTIDAFELWCWRRLLRVPWTARKSNQSILKASSLEGLMLKLKLQYFGHLMRRVDSLEKTLMLGGIGGRRSAIRANEFFQIFIHFL